MTRGEQHTMMMMFRRTAARRAWSVGMLGVAVVIGSIALQCVYDTPAQASAARQDDDDQDELAPLTLDAAKARPLEEAGRADAHDRAVTASVAENVACYVCHANYQTEELATRHAAGGVGCVDCHGKSYAHRNDENNTTPPDVMFPRDAIDPSCAACHDEHNVPAIDVIHRFQERAATSLPSGNATCTDCHGHHRLTHRTVVWDRVTRALVPGGAAAPSPAPRVDDLSFLGGTWVRLGAAGTPPERLTIVVWPDQQIRATWESDAATAAPPRVVSLRGDRPTE